jgi:hypothetical protein
VIFYKGGLMEEIYRDHKLCVYSEDYKDGTSILHYTVNQVQDGFECLAFCERIKGFYPERAVIDSLKQYVDMELGKKDPWGKKAFEDWVKKEGYAYWLELHQGCKMEEKA